MPRGEPKSAGWPGWLIVTLVAMSYFACVSAATFPVVLTLDSTIPGQLSDPLEHLWIIRWSQACLKEGISPFFCPELNYPTGVPLGYFPTMHMQTAAFLAMGLWTDNDVLRFNVLWFNGFVATGLSTFLLAWWSVRKFWPAWLAGMGAMLCGPMLMHAHGHVETMQMGAVPLFLIGWLRFVDRPGLRRMVLAVGLYLLVVACAPYFAVLAIFPAVCYLAWSWLSSETGQRLQWLLGKAGWLTAFGLVVLPGLALLFSSQIWAVRHGFAMGRSKSQFAQLGAPVWSSFVPSPLHPLGRWLTPDLFAATGYTTRLSECSSYLGVVTLGLLAYAAVRRVPFARRGFWWSALALMVILSWGSQTQLGSTRISLPAGWIYGIFPPFHLIRVPARFNLFAAVCAAVPASAALVDLLGRIKRPRARTAFAMAIASLMLVDLSMVPFEKSAIPPLPAIYRELAARDPGGSLVDAPMFGSNSGLAFSSLWGYWQSIHRLRTTAGYPGLANLPFEMEIVRNSPFWGDRLLDPAYLSNPLSERFGLVEGVNVHDYAWLFMSAHNFHHVVFHQGTWFDPSYADGSRRIQAQIAEAKAFEDADVVVFDRSRLHAPQSLTWLCAEGFRPALGRRESWAFAAKRRSRIFVVNPYPDRPVFMRLIDVSAFAKSRVVRLLEDDRELARWQLEPGVAHTIQSPPFLLDAGVRELWLESDGDERPSRPHDRFDDARTPYSLRLNSVQVRFLDQDS